jgi:hypothetical protein
MSRAGFTLLTVDVDEVSVGYPSMWELLDDLRDMGENNAIIGRCALHSGFTRSRLTVDSSRHLLHRDTLAAASAIYKGRSKSRSRGMLITGTFRASWSRRWHSASYVPGHLPSQLYLLLRPFISLTASVDWVETCTRPGKAIGKGFGQNKSQRCPRMREDPMVFAPPHPYLLCFPRWILRARRRPGTCALV